LVQFSKEQGLVGDHLAVEDLFATTVRTL
jgi:hypothetical protein